MKAAAQAIAGVLLAVCLGSAGPVRGEVPPGAVYLDGGDSPLAMVLVHGRGAHPRWKVVEPLRNGVHSGLGYHTLSLQMPNENKHWQRYADDFQTAYDRIAAGVRFLLTRPGVKKIVLMGHSMGARMVSAYVRNVGDPSLAAVIVVGCRNNGAPPLSCGQSLRDIELPVLDVWGNRSAKDVTAAAERADMVSARYTQLSIPGGGHRLGDREDELVHAVADWLRERLGAGN